MNKVKIYVEPGQSFDGAEEALYKALNAHRTGETHTEDFEDPAMQDTVNRMEAMYQIILSNIIEEVFRELDNEYSNDYSF